jgi:hypothetical protein
VCDRVPVGRCRVRCGFAVRRCVPDVQVNESDAMSLDGACAEEIAGVGDCWLVKGEP